ncbi:MAG: 2-amino-4-hydroxy-6-hydroxymethyldihydropteridine diphosphokinase [Pseudomonadota bacterium]
MAALSRLQTIAGHRILKRSSWYWTQPIGLEDPEWFINGVILLETPLLPEVLLARLLEIEASLGRKRMVKWEPRIIDLDLLCVDQLIMKRPELTLPHPFLEKRRFVLEPMAEIAPDFVHPVLHKTIAVLRDELGVEGQALVKLTD